MLVGLPVCFPSPAEVPSPLWESKKCWFFPRKDLSRMSGSQPAGGDPFGKLSFSQNIYNVIDNSSTITVVK